MNRLNLRAVIGNRWGRFKADFICKPLEERVKAGDVPVETLQGINYFLERYGSDALNFDCEVIRSRGSKHEVKGGWLGRVRVPIVDGLEITNFIKCFADKEGYDKSVYNQTLVARALSNTPLAGLVSQPVFTNNSERIVVDPFINGKLLHDSVRELEGRAKMDKLEAVIDSYFEWKGALEGKKLAVGEYGHPLDAMQKLLDCKADEPFIEVMRPLCQELRSGPKVLIHGDYHLSNIIENGRYHPIDWESFSYGYEEADAGKLMAKALLTPDQWDELMRYFAEKQKAVPVETSIRRQWLNRIRQEVFLTGRYIARSAHSPDLLLHTTIAYNKLLHTVQAASKHGFVDPSLEQSVIVYFEKQGLKTLSDDEYDKSKEYDPDLRQSFENGADVASLEERASMPQSNTEAEIARLRKNLYAWPWRKIRNIAIAACLGLAGLLGTGIGIKSLIETKNESFDEQTYEEKKYQNMFKENFRVAISVINRQKRGNFSSMKEAHQWNYDPVDVLPENDPLIDQLAVKYDFGAKFIRQMLSINRFYGMTDSERGNILFDNINYFEPQGPNWRFGRAVPTDPRKNLEMGLQLLAEFREQFRQSYKIENKTDFDKIIQNLRFLYAWSGNEKMQEKLRTESEEAVLDALALKDALIAFYSRYGDQNYGGEDNKRMGRILAYNVLTGLGNDEMSMTEYLKDNNWMDDKFGFTDESPLTKGKIKAIGYEDLKKVRAVRDAYRAQFSPK